LTQKSKCMMKNVFICMFISNRKVFVRIMILKQSKRRRTLFRRRKFDILIRSVLAKSLSTKNALYYINKISFSYLFV
jgi:hypothetical protein